ncbi:MAG: patatin-like phospholipase family protein [Bacteroidaceae bacterium]|nr:patatin-like phospholipase family protein [Bacteroidaceae bacterium]
MKKSLLTTLALWLCTLHPTPAQQPADTLQLSAPEGTRPKVGLVLSGGGARGAAHVGAIRLIEELQIPIDYVVGTSMGAIVGALYAIGYTADDMDSLFMTQDWRVLLSNDVPRQLQPYSQRMARRRYQVNIPYEKSALADRSAHYRDAGIKVRRSSLQTFPKVLARPGLIDGQNLQNVFAQLTYPYHDSLSYERLPHAFACVAADLVTGKEVVLKQGRLAESIRASMSIPGVFYPVYQGAQVLVDGGVVNNYPVNVARDMGADIIIGVELNSGITAASDLQSFAAIFERLIGTLGTELHERNVADTDILIIPQVKRFPVMGFDTLNLHQLIDIGYRTALQSRPQLDSLRQLLAVYEAPRCAPPTEPTAPHPVLVEQIIVKGYDRTALLALLQRYGISEGDSLSIETIGAAIERIYGMGTFSSVQYQLVAGTLFVEVKPNPSDQVALGLRIDSEEAAAALLNISIDPLKLSGAKFDLTTRLAVNPYVEARASYAWTGPQAHMAVSYWGSDVNRFYDDNSYTLRYNLYGADIALADLLSRDYDLRAGLRYDHYDVHKLVRDQALNFIDTENHESYLALYTALHNDKYDAAYLPTRGYAYGIGVAYNLCHKSSEGDHFGEIQAHASTVIPIAHTTALLPALYTRHLIGSHIPLIYSNAMGGYLPHRYLRQQYPFAGFVGSEFMDAHLVIARMELRQRLLADLYAAAIINYAYSTPDIATPTDYQSIWGAALKLTYDTTIGPLALCTHWSDRYHQMGFYFSLGFEF